MLFEGLENSPFGSACGERPDAGPFFVLDTVLFLSGVVPPPSSDICVRVLLSVYVAAMSHRKKVLLKVIILGDSGYDRASLCVFRQGPFLASVHVVIPT